MTNREVNENIPLMRPSIGAAELAAVEYTLRSGQLVLGPENLRFEALLAEATGRAHALCVNSGTTALELALWALSVGPGDEVIMPAGGYPAAAHATMRLGARPVLVDIDAATWTLDVGLGEAVASANTRAVISVDTCGLVAEAGPLEALCERLGSSAANTGSTRADSAQVGAAQDRAAVALVTDAACSLGGRDSAGRYGAGYGALGVLSFHPRKVITTGEGGAVVCDDDSLANRLRALRNQGQSAPGQFTELGTNARLSEVAASLGGVQMDRLASMLRERALLVEGYQLRLAGLRAAGKLTWQTPVAGAKPTHQTFAVMLDDHVRLPRRDQVRAYLAQHDIESQVAIYALPRIASVRSAVAQPDRFPVTDAVAERGLALPLYVGMRSAQLDRVCDTLAEVLQ